MKSAAGCRAFPFAMRYATNTLAVCVAGLLALGIVMLYSAGTAQTGARYLTMQLVWGGLGIVVCFVAAAVDYRPEKVAWPLFAITIVMLLLVLIPGVGIMKNGARRWFDLGPMNFQPPSWPRLRSLLSLPPGRNLKRGVCGNSSTDYSSPEA